MCVCVCAYICRKTKETKLLFNKKKYKKRIKKKRKSNLMDEFFQIYKWAYM